QPGQSGQLSPLHGTPVTSHECIVLGNSAWSKWATLSAARHVSHESPVTMSVRLKAEHLQLFSGMGSLRLRSVLRKYLNQGGFLEQGDAQNLQHVVEFQVQPQTL